MSINLALIVTFIEYYLFFIFIVDTIVDVPIGPFLLPSSEPLFYLSIEFLLLLC